MGRTQQLDILLDLLYVLTKSPSSKYHANILHMGAKVIGIYLSLIWSKTLMELIFNASGEFR